MTPNNSNTSAGRRGIRLFVCGLCGMVLPLTGHAGPAGPALVLDDLPLLFADDSGVAASSGVVRTLHPARTRPAPVLEPDRPWEGDRVYVYGTVLPDGTTGGFRMWYMGMTARSAMQGRTPTLRTNGRGLVLYATSPDGVVWTKPELGLHVCDGSAAKVRRHTVVTGQFNGAQQNEIEQPAILGRNRPAFPVCDDVGGLQAIRHEGGLPHIALGWLEELKLPTDARPKWI